ncbi:MAG: DUF899 family protein [Sciscionella sp.]|nr:DUF899 family protein [Sciscionella sp.]
MRNVHITASEEYRRARAELLAAERDLRDATARVANARAALPPGPRVDGSSPLTTATGKPTTLSALFDEHESLLVYHMMFDEGWRQPCPMCAMWIDGIDALVPQLTERTAVAVLAPAKPSQLAEAAKRRDWRWIRLVSTQPGELTDQLGLRIGEHGDGLEPALTCFVRDVDGVRVHWHGRVGLHDPAGEDDYRPADGLDTRGIDAYCAVWALFDLLPAGRGDWYASRQTR